MRRVRLFELEHLSLFSSITDEQIDEIVRDFISHHGSTTGEPYLPGYSLEQWVTRYTVQRRRIRESLIRVDPRNTALRWGALVSRRVFFHDETQRGLSGSIFKECGVVDPAFLSY